MVILCRDGEQSRDSFLIYSDRKKNAGGIKLNDLKKKKKRYWLCPKLIIVGVVLSGSMMSWAGCTGKPKTNKEPIHFAYGQRGNIGRSIEVINNYDWYIIDRGQYSCQKR